MKKTIEDNGEINVNGLSFLSFHREFVGFHIVSKKTKLVIPKFLVYWSGMTFVQIRKRFDLIEKIQA